MEDNIEDGHETSKGPLKEALHAEAPWIVIWVLMGVILYLVFRFLL